MYKSLKRWILYLNNPQLVANFQKLCGLKISTSKSNGSTKNGTNYLVTNKFLYYLFNLGSIFGDEGFLIIFFSMLLINFDTTAGRQVMLYWSMVMYIGQAMKDYYQMDRPSSPPVVILENRYITEFGMPSTHAMAAVAVPAALILNFHKKIPYYIFLAVLMAVLWCMLISISRLYKGVHSVADVVVGIVISIILVMFMSPWVEDFDRTIITSLGGIFSLLVMLIVMSTCYPDPPSWNVGRGDTYMILGSIFGVMLGSRLDYIVLSYNDSKQISTYYEATILMHISRLLLAIVVIVVCRFAFKPIILRIAGRILQVDPFLKSNWQMKYFEIIYKSLIYTVLGVLTTFFIPRLSEALNLGRLLSLDF